MPKISVIGICGNSVFLTVDKFHEKGQTLAADSCFEEIGGKGINQAVAAARMGADVCFLAAVGDDADGKLCRESIEKEGIDGCFAVKAGEKTTFAFILTDKAGENRVTVYRGAQLTPEDLELFHDRIAGSDILLLQNEVPEEVNRKAMQIADKHGVKVILNPAPARPVRGKVWLVTPNEQERSGLGNIQYDHCITTLGGDGCSIDQRTFLKALPVTPVDTTGAGDTFNGVLAACLAEGKTLEEACRWAVTAAGVSVTKSGVWNAIPYRNEIERMTP